MKGCGFNMSDFESTMQCFLKTEGDDAANLQEYDEQIKESYPVYPDFEENPEYTDEGRPFATVEQESCSHCKPQAPGISNPGDCGGCSWFHRKRPYDPIGICMCPCCRIKPD